MRKLPFENEALSLAVAASIGGLVRLAHESRIDTGTLRTEIQSNPCYIGLEREIKEARPDQPRGGLFCCRVSLGGEPTRLAVRTVRWPGLSLQGPRNADPGQRQGRVSKKQRPAPREILISSLPLPVVLRTRTKFQATFEDRPRPGGFAGRDRASHAARPQFATGLEISGGLFRDVRCKLSATRSRARC